MYKQYKINKYQLVIIEKLKKIRSNKHLLIGQIVVIIIFIIIIIWLAFSGQIAITKVTRLEVGQVVIGSVQTLDELDALQVADLRRRADGQGVGGDPGGGGVTRLQSRTGLTLAPREGR